MLEAMLKSWRAQKTGPPPSFSTIGKRLTAIRAFTRYVGCSSRDVGRATVDGR